MVIYTVIYSDNTTTKTLGAFRKYERAKECYEKAVYETFPENTYDYDDGWSDNSENDGLGYELNIVKDNVNITIKLEMVNLK